MSNNRLTEELRRILQPYIGKGTQKNDTVTKESVEDLIVFAEACHIEEIVIEYVKSHPDAVFWDFLRLIPLGYDGGGDD